jgi:hypothetical protein
LRQAHLFSDGGVTHCSRTNFASNHFSGVQPYPHLQRHVVVAPLHVDRYLLCLSLNVERRQAGAKRVILQCNRCPEHRHEAVAGELVHRAAESAHHRGRPVEELGHDLAQSFCADRGRKVHRMHDVREQHRHLLVFGVPTFRREPCTTAIAEPGIGTHVAPTVTAPVPHVNIVTLAPSSTRVNVRKLPIFRGVSPTDAHARGCRG